MTYNEKVNMMDLKLADVCYLIPDKNSLRPPYDVMTVKQVKDGQITFFRPYTHTADFSHTGGVICYVGISEFTTPIRADFEYFVFERKDLK